MKFLNRERAGEYETPEYFTIGRILKTHGIRGEVILAPYRIVQDEILDFESVMIETDNKFEEIVISQIRPHKDRYIVLFEGFSDINECQDLIGKEIYADADSLSDEALIYLFLQQTEGIRVEDSEGKEIGVLTELMETSGHPVFVIETPGKKELMIPAVDEFIEEIDMDDKKLVLNPPEGIFEIYDI
ncbi:MAG: 16S rRNA processing protein RimM [Acidobacteria bacterium]|nr:16S rRNA processing protein RimM [Acidobacteriota bacterium]